MAANNSNTISPIQQNDTVLPSCLHSHSHETFITYPWSLVVVTNSHHIAQANDCFADLLGYPKHVLAGTHLRNIFCDKATYNQIADHLYSPETTKKNSFKTAMLKKMVPKSALLLLPVNSLKKKAQKQIIYCM